MNRTVAVLSFVLALGVSTSLLFAQGQSAAHHRVVVPDSSVEQPGDRGMKAHTNHVILLPGDSDGRQAIQPNHETPGSLACVYQLVPTLVPGCPIATSNAVPLGGNGIIAIVDAYDYPTAYKDLSTFSRQFNLPVLPQCSKHKTTSCFQKVYATGVTPPSNCGWAQEAAIDIEWAHTMAPNASIVLVEAASNDLLDLLAAVDVANAFLNPTGIAAGTGLGQVSMSWGATEFPSEVDFDSHFKTPGVVYFAASGDVGGSTIYPGASPFVVSAGGTSIMRSGGSFLGEIAWAGGGGGLSPFEAIPSYQNAIAGIAGSQRAVPDLSFDADPNSGVPIFDNTPCQASVNGPIQVGWQVFGGTSVATPSLAGIVNSAGSKYSSTDTELSTIYACQATSTCYTFGFRDILTGSTSTSFSAGPGWDFTTGVGSPIGLNNK
jgi:kumamolisin